MNKAAPHSAERALLWAATSFAVLALGMIVGPYLLNYVSTLGIEDPDRAFRTRAAASMTFGLMMLGLGAFSWIASLIMSVVTYVFARQTLRSAHGCFLIIANLAIAGYGIFFISQIFR